MTSGTMMTSTPPNDFICPLSKKIMKDPVVTTQGISFERKAILQWLEDTQINVCPVTGAPLKASSLRTNTKLQLMIQYWHYKNETEKDAPEESNDNYNDDAALLSMERFVCPLTNQIMRDPVMIREGHNFERAALVRFIEKYGAISPTSGKPLGQPNFYINKKLAREIEQWQGTIQQQKHHQKQVQEQPTVQATSTTTSCSSKSSSPQVATKVVEVSKPMNVTSSFKMVSGTTSRKVMYNDLVQTKKYLLEGEDIADDVDKDVYSILNEVLAINVEG